MGRDSTAAPKVASHNLFSVLNNKAAQKQSQDGGQKKKKAAQPNQEAAPAPVKGAKADKKEEPKKVSKTISLAADESKQQAKEAKKEEKATDKAAKVENAKTDRHDRSGKGHQVRKEGKGTGGWAEGGQPTAEADAAEAKAQVVAEQTEDEKARLAEEAAARELEEKQMTFEEYQAAQKKKANAEAKAAFNIRKVDTSGFKNMSKTKKTAGDDFLRMGEKKVVKSAAKEGEQSARELAAAKKKQLQDTGFRMENPSAASGGRGGRGGRGEGRGRGAFAGRGRGGRGGYQAPKSDSEVPAIDSNELFPSLGGAPAAAAEDQ